MGRRLLNLTGVTACAALFTMAGCGDDDDQSDSGGGSAPKAFEISASGSGKNTKLTAPGSVPAGLTRITLRNSAKQPFAAQFVKVDGGQSLEQVAKAGEAWGDKAKPLPSWMTFAGGAPRALPGQESTATQVLTPGKYIAFDIETDAGTPFEVEQGDGTKGSLPAAPGGRVTASEYKFEASNLKSGKQRLLFENVGKEPHFMVAAPIKAGKTIADVRQFAKTEKGEDPIDEKGVVDTPVFDGGGRQVVTLNLEKTGKYALLCFVPDRKGGPPHVAKGMVSEAIVR